MCFNPRARDGRELPKFTNIIITNVSIHAPVMDANSQSEINAKRAHSFNPRARDGREIHRLS